MVINIKFKALLIKLFIFSTFTFFVVSLSGCHPQNNPKNRVIRLKPLQNIENYAKYSVFPLPFMIGEDAIKFYVEIESFQNQELLEVDLKDTAILEDDSGNLYLPKKWIILKRDKYEINGNLVFDAIPKTTTSILLKLYQTDDDTLKWTL